MPSISPVRHRPAPAAAMGSSRRTWNDGSVLAPKKRPEAIVVLHDDSVLSLASDEMNYEYLTERLSNSSSANFMTLVKDLRQMAVNAWVTPSTRISTGFSKVKIFTSGWFKILRELARVCVFPLPVGPVTRIIPSVFFNAAIKDL